MGKGLKLLRHTYIQPRFLAVYNSGWFSKHFGGIHAFFCLDRGHTFITGLLYPFCAGVKNLALSRQARNISSKYSAASSLGKKNFSCLHTGRLAKSVVGKNSEEEAIISQKRGV